MDFTLLAPYIEADPYIISVVFALTSFFAEEAEEKKISRVYVRLIAVALGALISLGTYGLSFNLAVSGAISGLVATGGYLGVSKLLKGVSKAKK